MLWPEFGIILFLSWTEFVDNETAEEMVLTKMLHFWYKYIFWLKD